jgi:MHS family shikimate/dehydroshikimate transporter-like MFS transporter
MWRRTADGGWFVERLGGENVGEHVPAGRVALASFVGTAIEWYDFFIYGTAAALVFGQLFFPPNEDPLIGTLAAFATYAVGFAARPVGGVVFGHFGDRVGRKSMLVITILTMGLATFLIGLLPTYARVGIWAPVLLVVLRLIQGFSVGGEWGGAALMTVEHAPEGRRGYYGSWTMAASPAGAMLATGAFALASGLPDEQFLAWGWRLPFLFSIVLVGVGLFIRLRILETPAFERIKGAGAEARLPVVEAVRDHPRSVLLAAGMYLGFNTFIFVLFTFMLSYATTQLGLPRAVVLQATVVGGAVQIASVLAFSALSDRVGRRPVMLAGAAFLALYAFPLFWLVNTGSPALIFLALAIGFFGSAAIFGPMAAFIAESFDTKVRYSGASLGYQMGAVLGGGLSPFVATALLAWSGGASWSVSVYLVLGTLISLLSVYLLAETYRSELSGAEKEDAAVT